MWPERGDAVSRAIPVEQAVEDLYAEALRRWTPTVRASVLPTLSDRLAASGASYNGDPLTAAALPPDPSAADDQTATEAWAVLAAGIVVGGATLLWAAIVVEALSALGFPIPELPAGDIDYDTPTGFDDFAINTVVSATSMTRREVRESYERIVGDPDLRERLDEFATAETERATRVPAHVRDRVVMSVARVDKDSPSLAPTEQMSERRSAAANVLDPAGADMREIARSAGHDSAAVQNHAIVTAAELNEDEDDPLDKVWICTIDSRTRDTHWAADGQRAPISGTFTVGGESLRFPHDPAGSPAETARCRCRVGILGRDEQLPDDVDRHTERLDGRDATASRRDGTQADEIERREERGNVRARDDEDGMGRTASGGWVAPSEQEFSVADDEQNETEQFRTFTDAVFALVGEPTSDGRMLATDIDLSMRTFPQPLMWCEQTGYGHEDAYTVGVVESARVDKGKVLGSGYMLNTEAAEKAANELAHGVTSPSVDLADTEWLATDRKGKEIDYDEYVESIEAGDPIKVYTTVTKGELIGCTLVATAAFGDTSLTLNDERESREVSLVAAATAQFSPRVFPAAAFADPGLTEPTLTTYTDDGRVFGHFACSDSCHRSIQGQCVSYPTDDDFANFHTSPPIMLDDGTTITVGRLTVGGGHASTARGVSGADAAAHYDNVATCWALVRVGYDAAGRLWFSGVRAPWATDEQFEMGLTAPLSGDWRDYGKGLRLTAVHSVNTPGFMIASGGTDAVGRPLSLVASLAPVPEGTRTVPGDDGQPLTRADIAEIGRAFADAQHERAKFHAERDAVLARVASTPAPDVPPEPAAPTIDELIARADAQKASV